MVQTNSLSPLQKARTSYQPVIPKILHHPDKIVFIPEKHLIYSQEVLGTFPNTPRQLLKAEEGKPARDKLKIGCVLSGGPAPGGHSVIAGLLDALMKINRQSELIGFLDGPSGIIDNKFIPITEGSISQYRHQGGFDLIGSGRTKIESDEQFKKALETVNAHDLDGLVVIGGDDSNTNAALLAEYFIKHGSKTKVVGVPKTIDGDLKNQFIEASFGFDTAAKTYSESIGNLLRDALSQKKYWFFIKLMGRSASHIALECALAAHPNLTLIGEEIAASKMTLEQIVDEIVQLIETRQKNSKNYGAILIPEGLIEFIPEFKVLIEEMNKGQLSPQSQKLLNSFPKAIQDQFSLDRDPHGNVQVSKIETERLLMEMVAKKVKFNGQPLFFGYEGRSALPTNFDCNYCYSLGITAACLINNGYSSVIAAVQNLAGEPSHWQPYGVPLASMIHFETRKGKVKPVIEKHLVDLNGKPFTYFKDHRDKWKLQDDYLLPGPIQFEGPLANTLTHTLALESSHRPTQEQYVF